MVEEIQKAKRNLTDYYHEIIGNLMIEFVRAYSTENKEALLKIVDLFYLFVYPYINEEPFVHELKLKKKEILELYPKQGRISEQKFFTKVEAFIGIIFTFLKESGLFPKTFKVGKEKLYKNLGLSTPYNKIVEDGKK